MSKRKYFLTSWVNTSSLFQSKNTFFSLSEWYVITVSEQKYVLSQPEWSAVIVSEQKYILLTIWVIRHHCFRAKVHSSYHLSDTSSFFQSRNTLFLPSEWYVIILSEQKYINFTIWVIRHHCFRAEIRSYRLSDTSSLFQSITTFFSLTEWCALIVSERKYFVQAEIDDETIAMEILDTAAQVLFMSLPPICISAHSYILLSFGLGVHFELVLSLTGHPVCIKGLRMMSLPVSNISCRHDRRSTTIRTVCFVKKLRRF